MVKRKDSFDLVKMLMMLWVVWGYLGLCGLVAADRSVYMENEKIGVNMPVFFVMAGYFAAATYHNYKWSKIVSRVVSYMRPHVTLPFVCAFFLVRHISFTPLSSDVRWLVAIAWFLVCHVIVLLIQHIKISRLFFFGDSVLIENCFTRIFRRSLKV